MGNNNIDVGNFGFETKAFVASSETAALSLKPRMW
jgi:hypothetical protein